jgi:FixJ family two-component response regulator
VISRLTQRESELLALLPAGMTNRELGGHLHLSENTIKTQLRNSSPSSTSAIAPRPSPSGQRILGDPRSQHFTAAG